MTEKTKEEEAVIEAARANHGRKCMIHMNNCPVCVAVDALDASRAPKRMPSAEERWMVFKSDLCGSTPPIRFSFIAHVNAAESAAWDRAIEAARVRLHEPAAWLTAMLLSLKGRCHDEGKP